MSDAGAPHLTVISQNDDPFGRTTKTSADVIAQANGLMRGVDTVTLFLVRQHFEIADLFVEAKTLYEQETGTGHGKRNSESIPRFAAKAAKQCNRTESWVYQYLAIAKVGRATRLRVERSTVKQSFTTLLDVAREPDAERQEEIIVAFEKGGTNAARVVVARGRSLNDTGAGASVSSLSREDQRHVLAALDPKVLDDAVKEKRASMTAERRRLQVSRLAEIAQGDTPLGSVAERFPIILADPPWTYQHNDSDDRAIEAHYPCMDLEAIRAMPLADICTPDAVLFLWATSPKLAEAMSVIEAWGFKYRTCAVWVKNAIGMGYYWRQRHELLLLAVKGNPPCPAPADRVDSVIEARKRAHSQKPVEAYEHIEGFYPTLPKIELFAREPRTGWTAWGNQSGNVA